MKSSQTEKGKLGYLEILVGFTRKLIPDPFNVCVYLSLIAIVTGYFSLLNPPKNSALNSSESLPLWSVGGRVLEAWYEGFGNPRQLAFAFQMCLILVTGGALARTPVISRFLKQLAKLVSGSTSTACVTVALLSMLCGLINWGLSLVFSAILVREIGRFVKEHPLKTGQFIYPLVAGAAYMGLAVWHGGLSGSAPLLVSEIDALKFSSSTMTSALISDLGSVDKSSLSVPMDATIFTYRNAGACVTMLVIIPVVFWLLSRKEFQILTYKIPNLEEEPAETDITSSDHTFARTALVAIAVVAILSLIWVSSKDFFDAYKLPFVTFAFLFLGLLLFKGPGAYMEAITRSAKEAGAIIIQYPFYFGISSVIQKTFLTERLSGIILTFTDSVLTPALGSEKAFIIFIYLSAAILNIFIPSGGGKWFVQGPIIFDTAARLLENKVSLDAGKIVLAMSYGDQVTDMIQPFFALPILYIARLRAQDLLSYTAIISIVAFIIYLFWLVI